MKRFRKASAMMLSLVMTAGMFPGLVAMADETEEIVPEVDTEASEVSSEEDLESEEQIDEEFLVDEELTFDEVVIDEDIDEYAGTRINIWSWNEEFPYLVDRYTTIDYDLEISESNIYQVNLDQALASGENAPDLFVADYDWTHKYNNSSYTLPISTLGITQSELSQMFDFTLQYGTDNNGVLKGLAWMCCPSVVWYNRTLAQRYLGVSDPASVQPFFSTWDAYLNTARTVNQASNGEVKIVSGLDDNIRFALGSRTQGWVVDGYLNVDPFLLDYMDIARAMYDECLTWESTQWGDLWAANMSNERVLSYSGPLWLSRFSMGLYDASNPTSGDWSAVCGPSSYCWGGTNMYATTYATSAERTVIANVMRKLATDTTTMYNMACNGEFVNNKAVMNAMTTNAAWNIDWLGGQNPVSYLVRAANSITVFDMPSDYNEYRFTDAYGIVLNRYLIENSSRIPTPTPTRTPGVTYPDPGCDDDWGCCSLDDGVAAQIGERYSKYDAMCDFEDEMYDLYGLRFRTNPVTPPVSVDGANSFVGRIYSVALDRICAESERDFWSIELVTQTMTGAELARFFFFAEEFQNRSATMSNEQYVDIIYSTFFGRSADVAGSAYWCGQLASGTISRNDVVNQFADTKEWANLCYSYGIQSGGAATPDTPTSLFATRLYTTCLGRDAEAAGVDYWTEQLNSGMSGSQVARMFFFGSEFTGRGYSNAEYVTCLYRTFFDRDPDSAGLNYWIQSLSSGTTRTQAFNMFTATQEWTAVCREAGIRP